MDNREVFISYHTESAKETVQTICRMLEDAGITCWYAPRDVSGPYARAIIDAIEKKLPDLPAVGQPAFLRLQARAQRGGHRLRPVQPGRAH